MLRNAVGGGRGSDLPEKSVNYEDVRFNLISVMRGVPGCRISRKRCYVTLEWPLSYQRNEKNIERYQSMAADALSLARAGT